MPFRSKAQVRKLYATNPALAKRWEDKYGIPKGLPEHIGPRRKKKRGRAPKSRLGDALQKN